jgi:serine/threonine protein phosphatase PrpC
MADITARFRLDISGVDAALARIAAGTLAVQGAFAAANAALAPLAGAFNAVKESLDLGGQLSDISAQTGIAVDDLVVLRQAFQNAGVGADGVGPAINRLQKALGAGNQFVNPQVGETPCRPGDRFLICTDGVTDALYNDQLPEVLAECPKGTPPALHLVGEAIERSGRDNTTAVIIAVEA